MNTTKEYLLQDMKNLVSYLDQMNGKITNIINNNNSALVINGLPFKMEELRNMKTNITNLKNNIKTSIIPSLETEISE